MPGPQPTPIALTGEERTALERLARGHTTGQLLARRARIVLGAADGLNNAQVGAAVGVTTRMARQWRGRWLTRAPAAVADRLADAPRPGAPPRFTPEQWCRIAALACEPPGDSGRPIDHWTAREVADEAALRQIVPRISARSVGRFLGSWLGPRSSPIAAATG